MWAGRIALACVASVLALVAGAGRAAQVDSVTVSHRDSGFTIVFDGVVDAPAARVYDVLSDYARLGRLNPAITSVSVTGRPTPQTERVRSVFESCILFFCPKIVQVLDVTRPDARTIVDHVVPGQGDFEGGSSTWRITNQGPRTRLHYEAMRVAAFWIPPLIGRWAIERTLREQLEFSVAILERLASEKPVSSPRGADRNPEQRLFGK